MVKYLAQNVAHSRSVTAGRYHTAHARGSSYLTLGGEAYALPLVSFRLDQLIHTAHLQ